MTDYGDSGAKIQISTTYTGSAGSETPTGSIFYFWAVSWRKLRKALMKIKELAGGNSYSNKDGKRTVDVTFKDWVVVPWSTYNNTEAYNACEDFFAIQTKTGASPCYLFVLNEVDNTYLKLGHNAACTSQTRYLKGYALEQESAQNQGNIYMYPAIKFKECLL